HPQSLLHLALRRNSAAALKPWHRTKLKFCHVAVPKTEVARSNLQTRRRAETIRPNLPTVSGRLRVQIDRVPRLAKLRHTGRHVLNAEAPTRLPRRNVAACLEVIEQPNGCRLHLCHAI